MSKKQSRTLSPRNDSLEQEGARRILLQCGHLEGPASNGETWIEFCAREDGGFSVLSAYFGERDRRFRSNVTGRAA